MFTLKLMSSPAKGFFVMCGNILHPPHYYLGDELCYTSCVIPSFLWPELRRPSVSGKLLQSMTCDTETQQDK